MFRFLKAKWPHRCRVFNQPCVCVWVYVLTANPSSILPPLVHHGCAFGFGAVYNSGQRCEWWHSKKKFSKFKIWLDKLKSNMHKRCFLFCLLRRTDTNATSKWITAQWMSSSMESESFNAQTSHQRSGNYIYIYHKSEHRFMKVTFCVKYCQVIGIHACFPTDWERKNGWMFRLGT